VSQYPEMQEAEASLMELGRYRERPLEAGLRKGMIYREYHVRLVPALIFCEGTQNALKNR